MVLSRSTIRLPTLMSSLPPNLNELYPFQSHFLQLADGHRLHYLDEGQGPVVILLHGNPTWSFYYRDLVLGLRNRFRVIVPDHLGCGLSDKPQDYDYRLENHVANLTALTNHLKLDRYALGVHDWGGPIGMGHAVAHPERITRLLIFNTTCHLTADYPLEIRACRWPILGAIGVRGLNLFLKLALKRAILRPGGLDRDTRAGYLYPYDSWAHRVAIHRFIQDIPMSPSHPSQAYGTQTMGQLEKLVDKPMLLIWGLGDFVFTEAFLAQWQARFPKAETIRLSDAGHWIVEDAGIRLMPQIAGFLGD
jgi:cis-3-alkyl-4-acyloxetan-2-one decarboxylase